MPATSRPTSRDVAQAAGVSQSTVSLVMGGKWTGRVSPATARSVRRAAAELGYRPNLAARNLRLGTTRTVLLMVPTLTAPFFGPVYTGAARVAVQHGFGVVVYPWPDDARPADSPFAVPHEAIDGILASSMAVAALDRFHGTPAVMLDSDPEGAAPTVDFDVAGGMRAVAAHLAGLGHRRIGHVAAAVDQWTFRARGDALAAAVAALPGGVLTRATAAIEVGSAKAAAGRLLDRPAAPTALVCDDDLIAAGAYKAALARGLTVPSDLSVTGFDDVLLATALEPELSTVRLPAEELGVQGMTALIELLGGGRPAARSLPARLVVRGSTAPPPAA
ncbi:LacI family DNA-binding transcriptional regulator [Actinomadura xylanilytica]|uniref:LacI family DNA-binding transcriptional regulator n=1 Tax=Actinomadura xylanilytica TaxID=887459 RepID=UPI00255AB508|nr:LacI family DNA-binding transcriptional regulator [Actinomadura xylanilytica]MDL4772387.1 LacI family DNA-binding transcriptional regulator [Actinomadura xylanilytica]